MNVTPLSLNSACISDMCGIITMHGPHQVAQNSTTYTLSAANSVTSDPCSHLSALSLGAGSPTFSDGSGLSVFGLSGCFLSSAWASAARLTTATARKNFRMRGWPLGESDDSASEIL